MLQRVCFCFKPNDLAETILQTLHNEEHCACQLKKYKSTCLMDDIKSIWPIKYVAKCLLTTRCSWTRSSGGAFHALYVRSVPCRVNGWVCVWLPLLLHPWKSWDRLQRFLWTWLDIQARMSQIETGTAKHCILTRNNYSNKYSNENWSYRLVPHWQWS